MDEIALTDGCINIDIPMSCIPDSAELAGDMSPIPSGVFKVFNNIFYNQKLIDDYSCTLVSAFTALSNGMNVEVPLWVIREAFNDYKASGKFTD